MLSIPDFVGRANWPYFAFRMAFGQVDPEKILGMKPEELKTRLENGVTKEELADVKKSLEGFTSGLDEIKLALKTLTTKPPEPPPVVEPGDPTSDLLTDPKGFIRSETLPLHNATLANQASVQEIRARQDPRYRGIFEKYGDALIKYLDDNKVPVQQRAATNFWDYAIRTFVGEKVMSGEIKANSYPTLIGTSSVSPNPNDPEDPNKGLDPDMAQFYKKQNIPLERAKKIMDLMGKGEHITLDNVKGTANA